MRRLETVIFDVSGVLIDDLYTVWKTDSDAFVSCGFGKIENIEKFKESFKLPVYEYYKDRGVPENAIPKLKKEWRRVYPKYSGFIKIFPEVKSILKKLKEEKLNLAVASNIPSLFLREHLQRFRIDGYFDVITGQDDCEEQKPSPRPLLVTLEKLGSKPEQSAYVGDMEEDIIAGKRAHVYTFAITRNGGYHPIWRLKRQSPDFLISDLDELLTIVKRLNSSIKGE